MHMPDITIDIKSFCIDVDYEDYGVFITHPKYIPSFSDKYGDGMIMLREFIEKVDSNKAFLYMLGIDTTRTTGKYRITGDVRMYVRGYEIFHEFEHIEERKVI